jgi:peptidoglycan/LPS O-acetylase OafA/YrhL
MPATAPESAASVHADLAMHPQTHLQTRCIAGTPPVKRSRQLDAVRGLAVLVVLMHNTFTSPPRLLQPVVNNGWMGVDLFFVLSGFLITGILLDTKDSQGYFGNFYARRCLRIWPLYYSALLFMFVLVPLIHRSAIPSVFSARSSPWWAFPLFIQNFLVPVPTQATGLLGVTWSLAVEEQFYVVWPLVVRFCTTAQLRAAALAVVGISPILRFFLSLHHINIYSNTFCRLDGLMAGALLALAVRSRGFVPSRFVPRAWVTFGVSAAVALLLESMHQRWIVFSFVALASVSFVYIAMFSRQRQFQAILTNRLLVYTGIISYGIYLLEKIPPDLATAAHMENHPWLLFPITVAATYAIASLSWVVLEKPFLRLKRYFKEPRRILSTERMSPAAPLGENP